jgi:tight adherence protein B
MSSFSRSLSFGMHRVIVGVSTWSTWASTRVTPIVAAALFLLAGILVAYAISVAWIRNNDAIGEMLQPYRLLPRDEQPAERTLDAVRPLVRRAGEYLVSLIEARGLRPALDRKLQRAGLSISTGEFLLLCALAIVGVAGVGGLLGGIVGGIVGAIIGGIAPFVAIEVRVERRQRAFDAQLPNVLKIVASSLRAGFSLLQSLGGVIDQCADPMQHELRIAMSRIRLGEAIEDALGDVHERTGSRDFYWTVMAIRIQREVGGNLAEILDTVATTMVERERLRREVQTLTAEGRASAFILATLPVALGLFIYVANRPYIDLLFTTFPGEMALATAVAMEIFGGWWMRRTIQIEV